MGELVSAGAVPGGGDVCLGGAQVLVDLDAASSVLNSMGSFRTCMEILDFPVFTSLIMPKSTASPIISANVGSA